MFDVRRIHGTMSTNTIDTRYQSIHDKKYCQVFGNKQFFVELYPIKRNYDCHLGLDKFVKEYGAPDKMNYGGAQEQIGRKTEFQRVMGKYEITGHVIEPNGKPKCSGKMHTRTTTEMVLYHVQEVLPQRSVKLLDTLCIQDHSNHGIICSRPIGEDTVGSTDW